MLAVYYEIGFSKLKEVQGMNGRLAEQAIAVGERAAEAEKNGNIAESIQLYLKATELLLQATNSIDCNSDDRTRYRAQSAKYLDRVEYLKSKDTHSNASELISSGVELNLPKPTGTALEKGIAYAGHAASYDNAGKYPEAIRCYEQAVEYFLHAMRYEVSASAAKDKIRTRCSEYLDRAEVLKNSISASTSGKGKGENPSKYHEQLTVAARAAVAEKNGSIDEAIRLYSKAAELLLKMTLSKDCSSDDSIKYRAQLGEFMDRIVSIKSLKIEKSASSTPNQPVDLPEPTGTAIEKGIAYAGHAAAFDKAGKYREAIRCYEQAVESFLHVAMYEASTDAAKEKIRARCGEYLSRAEALKASLSDAPDGAKTPKNK